MVLVVHDGVRGTANLNPAGHAAAFHAAGDVHGVTPYVKGAANNTRETAHHWAAANANAKVEIATLLLIVLP